MSEPTVRKLTIVFTVAPGVSARHIVEAAENVGGVRASILSWSDAIADRDESGDEIARLRLALREIADQEQHDGQPETHMHDMADIARAALAKTESRQA